MRQVRQHEVHEAIKADSQATLQGNVEFQHARLQKFLVSPVWTRTGRSACHRFSFQPPMPFPTNEHSVEPRSVSGDGDEAEARIREFEEKNIVAKKELKAAEKETAVARGQFTKVKGVAEEVLELYDTREQRRLEAEAAAQAAEVEANRLAKLKADQLKAVKVNLDGQPIWKTPRTLRGTCVSWEDATTLAGREVYYTEYSEGLDAGDAPETAKANASLAAQKTYRGEVRGAAVLQPKKTQKPPKDTEEFLHCLTRTLNDDD